MGRENGGVQYTCPSGLTKCMVPAGEPCRQAGFPEPSGFQTLAWNYSGEITPFDGQWCNPQASKLVVAWEDFELEQLSPDDENYSRAFDQLACGGVADPSSLWGDNGPGVPGYGGINTYAVVKVVEDDMWLYGARGAFGADISNLEDLNSPWFVDAETIADHPDLNTYQNDKVATCFDWTYWMECKIRKGAVMVVGSGAPRNCSVDMVTSRPGFLHADGPSCVPAAFHNESQSYCYPTNPAIKEYQEPSNSILQYVMTPMLEGSVLQNIESCKVCELDVDDVTKSCDDKGLKYVFTPKNWTSSKVSLPGDGPDKMCPQSPNINLKRHPRR